MNIYVIRHGRTENNDQGLFNGRKDEDINSVGIEQAKQAGKKVAQLGIDIVVCSPMLRARHTAELVNTTNAPVVFDERLMERDTRSLTGTPCSSVDRDKYWNYYTHDYDAESPKEVCERAWAVIDDIKEKYNGRNVLIVTHKGVARAIYGYFYGVPDDGNMLYRGDLDNCEIGHFEV